MNKLDVLSITPLFEGIHIQDTLTILNRLKAAIKRYKKGDLLFSAGSPVKEMGIVLEGQIRIIKVGSLKSTSSVTASQGDLFAEALAGANCEHSPLSALALCESSVLWIPVADIIKTCDQSFQPQIRLISNYIRILSDAALNMSSQLEILSKRTTRQKILAYLWEQAALNRTKKFQIPLNRLGLADYLCVDRSAMTRELAKMQKEGLIRFNRNTFEIL